MSSPFVTRRLVSPPAPASEILIPILTIFLAVTLSTMYYIVLPPPAAHTANYQLITYQYHPPEPTSTAVTVLTENSINGQITTDSITYTWQKPVEDTDCGAVKCLALTFDDGPSYHTDRLLDILANSHAQATFFVLGHRVQAFSGQIARIANEGHEVGSHSWIHRNLPRFSYALVFDDLSGTTGTIQSITDQPVKFFRPPYGSVNSTVSGIAAALGQQIVLWSVDPKDWQTQDAGSVCDHVVAHANPGAVVLLHDIYATSVDAAQCIIDRLSSDYVFVNLSTLYQQ